MITEEDLIDALKRTQRELNCMRDAVERLLNVMSMYCEEHFLLVPIAQEPVRLRDASERMRAVALYIDRIRSASRVRMDEFDSLFKMNSAMERVAEQINFAYEALDALLPVVPLSDVPAVTEGLRRFRRDAGNE